MEVIENLEKDVTKVKEKMNKIKIQMENLIKKQMQSNF